MPDPSAVHVYPSGSTPPPSAGNPHRLWGGRFQGDSAPEFIALNNSIGVDFRLWPYDVRASKAWAVALWGAGVLTLEESKAIEHGLDEVGLGVGAEFTAENGDAVWAALRGSRARGTSRRRAHAAGDR